MLFTTLQAAGRLRSRLQQYLTVVSFSGLQSHTALPGNQLTSLVAPVAVVLEAAVQHTREEDRFSQFDVGPSISMHQPAQPSVSQPRPNKAGLRTAAPRLDSECPTLQGSSRWQPTRHPGRPLTPGSPDLLLRLGLRPPILWPMAPVQSGAVAGRSCPHYDACSPHSLLSIRGFSGSPAAWKYVPAPAKPTRLQEQVGDTAPQPDLVDQYLGEACMSAMEQRRLRLQQVVRQYQRFHGDSGSTEVQVALLSEKIASLAEHMAGHRKDFSSRRGLQAALADRRALLQYLRRADFEKYAILITRLGLKDSYSRQDRITMRWDARGGEKRAPPPKKKKKKRRR